MSDFSYASLAQSANWCKGQTFPLYQFLLLRATLVPRAEKSNKPAPRCSFLLKVKEKSLNLIPIFSCCLDLPASGCSVSELRPSSSLLCLPLWRRLLRSKCQVELQASLPVQGPARAALESNSLAVVPPAVDGNPRRRQECARAWSRPRSAQTSARRQVCSARPHSCCFLFLFGAAVTMCCAVKVELGYEFSACELLSRTVWVY